MKKIFSAFLFILFCMGLHAQDATRIAVALDKPFKGMVYLCKFTPRLTRIDSVVVDGTSFVISHQIERGDEYRLMSKPFRFDTSIVLEPSCNYEVRINGFGGTVLKGGREQARMDSLNRVLKPLEDSLQVMGQRYSLLKEQGKNQEAEKMIEPNNKLFDKLEKIRVDFIRAEPKRLSSMLAVENLLSNNYPLMSEVHQILSKSPYTYTSVWFQFDRKVQQLAKQWMAGNMAPDFTTKDVNGKIVRLSDFRGKTVLLDFWASWCIPCREKMKKLKAMYPELQKHNITVVSISLDEKRQAWLKATKEEGVSWTNTCDLVPFNNNKIAKAYHVSSVPQLFVVSPEGVIVSQDPDISSLVEH